MSCKGCTHKSFYCENNNRLSIYSKLYIILLIAFCSFSISNNQLYSQDIKTKKAASDKNFPGIELNVTDGSRTSVTTILFIENMTFGLDPSWDISGYGYDENFHIYSRLVEDNGNIFSIQCLPDDNFQRLNIPIGLLYDDFDSLIFSATILNNLPENCFILFEDSINSRITDLRDEGSYYKVEKNNLNPDTFQFRLYTYDILEKRTEIQNLKIKEVDLFQEGDYLIINNQITAETHCGIVNLSGKLLIEKKLKLQSSSNVNISDLKSGVYIIYLKSKDYFASSRIIIR